MVSRRSFALGLAALVTPVGCAAPDTQGANNFAPEFMREIFKLNGRATLFVTPTGFGHQNGFYVFSRDRTLQNDPRHYHTIRQFIGKMAEEEANIPVLPKARWSDIEYIAVINNPISPAEARIAGGLQQARLQHADRFAPPPSAPYNLIFVVPLNSEQVYRIPVPDEFASRPSHREEPGRLASLSR